MTPILTPQELERVLADRDSADAQVAALDAILASMDARLADLDLLESIYIKFADDFRIQVVDSLDTAVTRQDAIIAPVVAPHILEILAEFPPGSPTGSPGTSGNDIRDWVVRDPVNGSWTAVSVVGPETRLTDAAQDFVANGVLVGDILRVYEPSPSTSFSSHSITNVTTTFVEVLGDITSVPGAQVGENYTVEIRTQSGSDAFSNTNNTDPTQLDVIIELQDNWDAFAGLLSSAYEGSSVRKSGIISSRVLVEQYRDDIENRGDVYNEEFPP